jgi:putative nucleotidyltransferase with HDIG domain
MLTLDDDPIITSTIQSYFQRSGYLVDTEKDPYAAIERVRNGSYDILLLDFLMTPICGDQVIARIREFNKDIFIILLTAHKSMAPPIKTIRELDIQGYYEKSDRFDQLELLVESCAKSVRQLRTIRQYKDELAEAYDRMRDGYLEMVSAIRLMVDAKDFYTRGHSDRVSYFAEAIARRLGKDEAYCERLRIAGLFHDVGKVGISDGILLKENRLTQEEYEVIKTHPEKGAAILSTVSRFQEIVPIIRGHHERYDGNGYPDKLSGENIPEEARIITVADSFDAMISTRRYRESLGIEKALQELRDGRGTQFDPRFADTLIELTQEPSFLQKAPDVDIPQNEDWRKRQ